MKETIRPMLAAKTPASLAQLRYPVYASYKIDGVRCLILTPHQYSEQTGKTHRNKYAVAVSRTIKPIPNRYLQTMMDRPELVGFDGELCVGPPNAPDLMQVTMSGVMSHEGKPPFSYHVFDMWNRGQESFSSRIWPKALINVPPYIKVLPQYIIETPAKLEAFEQSAHDEGYEGVVIRLPNSPYKFNRSTIKEQYLVKIKRYQTDEAEIIDVSPVLHNGNMAVYDERGYTKRSTHKDGTFAIGILGSFLVRDLETGVEFSVGAGSNLTMIQRTALWNNRQSLINKIITYKHFAQTGVKDAPRNPIFLSFRDTRDL